MNILDIFNKGASAIHQLTTGFQLLMVALAGVGGIIIGIRWIWASLKGDVQKKQLAQEHGEHILIGLIVAELFGQIVQWAVSFFGS